jgi:prepilin-type N-terminal cleavage/methylation domain-containing protein
MRMSAALRWRRRPRSRGLTLIELVVVLVVLVALAGILVPLFPSMIRRTQAASGADNVTEVLKAVQLHEALQGEYPSGLDSLIASNGSGGFQLADIVKTPGGILAGPFDMLTDPNDNTMATVASALKQAGITTTYGMNNAGPGVNATFSAYAGNLFDVSSLDNEGRIMVLTSDPDPNVTSGTSLLGLKPVDSVNGPINYAVFGLGSKSTAIGKTMVDAPVRFLSNGDSPVDTYARWLLIFEIPKTGPARLAAVAGVDDTGIFGLSAHLNQYYETVSN